MVKKIMTEKITQKLSLILTMTAIKQTTKIPCNDHNY